jgi:hypothetical protein
MIWGLQNQLNRMVQSAEWLVMDIKAQDGLLGVRHK